MFCHLRLPIPMDEARLRLLGFRHHLRWRERLLLKRSAAELLLNRLAQVLDQMKPVGDLARLRRAARRPLGVEAASVAADDLDLWTTGEPCS
ncbi:hypothetical protein [Methylosinus sp.]|uniref:hypothetical protein n=1 Tax=Methylosinus sp. TaxID=427 RepID=UPI002F95E0A1